MTIASVLLALLTASSTPAGNSTGPALLDFHAEWCGPCHKMRPAVEQLIRKGYPIKTIDIDQEAQLRQRYHVESVPTFIVVDGSGREIDRTAGLQSAAELARFYKAAAAKVQPPANSNAHVGSRDDNDNDTDGDDDDDRGRNTRAHSGRDNGKNARDDRDEDEDADQAEPTLANPKPWETVVRIRVLGNRSTGFGSGTIIYSTPEESLILTCAHIFQAGRTTASPALRIPAPDQDRPVRWQSQRDRSTTRSTFMEAVEGWAVDYDFHRDVGLIRIKPGRRLPACRVVPAHWQPQPHMQRAHGRLLGRARRDGVAHHHHQGTHPELSRRAIRPMRRSSATSPPSRGAPAADCSQMTATWRVCATSRNRKATTAFTRHLGRSTSCSTATT